MLQIIHERPQWIGRIANAPKSICDVRFHARFMDPFSTLVTRNCLAQGSRAIGASPRHKLELSKPPRITLLVHFPDALVH